MKQYCVNGEIIEKAMKFVSDEKERNTLKYILVEDTEGPDGNTVVRNYVATDGRSLFWARQDVEIHAKDEERFQSDRIEGKLLIRPINAFKAHRLALLSPVGDVMGNSLYILSNLVYGFDGMTICHTIGENFPNWRLVVPADEGLKPVEDYVPMSWRMVRRACEAMGIDNLPTARARDGRGAHAPNVYDFDIRDVRTKIVLMPLRTN